MKLSTLILFSLILTLFTVDAFSQVDPNLRNRLRQQNRNQHGGGGSQVRPHTTPRPNTRYNNSHHNQPRPNTYNQYHHTTYNHNYVQTRRYLRTVNYYNHVVRYNRNYIRGNWIFYPQTYSNGYYVIDQYPYYVYNGYRHRYSMTDSCDYQLVDSYTNTVTQNFSGGSCARDYDSCARERDWQNNYEYSDRYFCAETFSRSNYNY